MGEQLTQSDVKKIQEEIDYRKLVVRKKKPLRRSKKPEPREISARILSTMRQREIRIKMRAGSVIWREC